MTVSSSAVSASASCQTRPYDRDRQRPIIHFDRRRARRSRASNWIYALTNSNATEPGLKLVLPNRSTCWNRIYLIALLSRQAKLAVRGVALLFQCQKPRSPDRPNGRDCRDDHEAIEAGVFIAKQIAAEVPPDQPRHILVLIATGRSWFRSRLITMTN
jgi:hypothetical protein